MRPAARSVPSATSDREAGLIEKGVPIGPAEQAEFLPDADELAKMDKEIAATE